MYRILASSLDGRDMHSTQGEFNTLLCLALVLTTIFPNLQGRKQRRSEARYSVGEASRFRATGRALLQVPGVCTLLPAACLLCSNDGMVLVMASPCPFTGSQPFSQAWPAFHPLRLFPAAFKHLQKLHLSISDFPSNFLLPWHQSSLKLYCPPPLFLPSLP